MFEERLIAEVQKYPHIYNKGDAAYRNKFKRDRAWMEVAAALDDSREQCQSRWRTLRDRYVKEINKESNSTGSAAKDQRPWKHMEEMAFLREHVAHKTLANFEYADDSEDFQQADAETSLFLSEDSEFIPEKQRTTSKQPPPKKVKVTEAEEKFCALVGTVQNILSAKVKASRNAEFLAMLDTYLHKLNDDQQDFLKIEILNFVYQRSRKIKKGSASP